MKKRVITALLLVAICFPVLYFGGYFLAVFAGIVALCCQYELVKNYNSDYPLILKLILALIFGFSGFYIVVNCQTNIFIILLIFYLLVTVCLSTLFACVTIEQSSLLFIVYVLILCMCFSLANMHKINIYLILWFLLATFLTDIFALFIGKLCGKHKLIARISPNKTFEGAIGGYLMSFVLSFLFAKFVLKDINSTFLLVGSLLMPLTAQFGDLFFSSIKRRYQIKDFSQLLPGHGGILDRIDSLLINGAVLFILFNLISGIQL